jgi:tRNA (cytidine/uridine-2'-O-)-methyltransferase
MMDDARGRFCDSVHIADSRCANEDETENQDGGMGENTQNGTTNGRDSAKAENPESRVDGMYEYGYRKSNYGPDELVTDAHGNPISVVDAMMSAREASETETVTPHLCYYSPRIPGNTGSAIRLCAVTGSILHLVEPLGFNLHDTKLRRAGLDYHDMAHVVLHPDFDDLVTSMPNSRIIAFTAHATKLYTEVDYKPSDILLFGPEPGDIPDPMDIMAGPHVAEQVRLPMRPSLRSLNLTNCASIALYEAWRQLGFKGGA